jgi:hypothetical protein
METHHQTLEVYSKQLYHTNMQPDDAGNCAGTKTLWTAKQHDNTSHFHLH